MDKDTRNVPYALVVTAVSFPLNGAGILEFSFNSGDETSIVNTGYILGMIFLAIAVVLYPGNRHSLRRMNRS